MITGIDHIADLTIHVVAEGTLSDANLVGGESGATGLGHAVKEVLNEWSRALVSVMGSQTKRRTGSPNSLMGRTVMPRDALGGRQPPGQRVRALSRG